MTVFTQGIHSRLALLICAGSQEMSGALADLSRADTDWHLEQVHCASQAIGYLENHYPALVIVDQNFSGNGFEFCKHLREMRGYAEQPVLMIIEQADTATVEQLRSCNATEFETRHADVPALRFRIEQMLKHARVRQEGALGVEEIDSRHMDSLTGLLNRRHFKYKFEQCLRQATESHRSGAVMLVDVDDFKRVNSSFDYQTGDYILKVVARRLASVIRDSDMIMRDVAPSQPQQILARIGGDEFTLFIDGVSDVATLMSIANRVADAIAAPLLLDGYEMVLSASIGIAVFSKDGEDVDTLLRKAEQAMYASKCRAGELITFYNPEMESAARTRFLLESEMRKSLETNQFELHYQPQVDVSTGRVTRMEALCRWRHPEFGLVPPTEFIPIAEESGLIYSLGDWVLIEACRQIKLWLAQGVECERVAVNVSARQFFKPDFVNKVREILALHDISGTRLELELTESIIMNDVEENIRKFNQLREMGITLAVDDFGTGYSSLSYLKRLPIDTLKIEKTFVSQIEQEAADVAIIEAILALANRLDFRVVAEGVEQDAQLAFLRRKGCDLCQGYLFSRPVPPEQAAGLFTRKEGERLYGETCA